MFLTDRIYVLKSNFILKFILQFRFYICRPILNSLFPSGKFVYRVSGSSVDIASDYGLDDPGSNPGGDEIFRPSRPALGPTQPPVKWVPGLYWGKVRPGRAADHSPPSSAAVMEE